MEDSVGSSCDTAMRRVRVMYGHMQRIHGPSSSALALLRIKAVSETSSAMRFPKVGFVGGGQMATALATGMVSSGFTPAEHIVASDVTEMARKSFEKQTGCKSSDTNEAAVQGKDVIILAVKPQVMPAVLRELRSILRPTSTGLGIKQLPLLVSIVAGYSAETILGSLKEGQEHLPVRLVRVMPNTPALIGKGASAFSLAGSATKEDAAIVERLLTGVGIAVEVPEKLLDAVTGLSGSGPAYVYQFIESLSDGGVSVGLPRDLATRLAAQTVLGAAHMVLQTGEHPAVLKDRVASPAGTTIAGLHALENGGSRAAVINAVKAATLRSMELGKQ